VRTKNDANYNQGTDDPSGRKIQNLFLLKLTKALHEEVPITEWGYEHALKDFIRLLDYPEG
jgi:hypothetical protein